MMKRKYFLVLFNAFIHVCFSIRLGSFPTLVNTLGIVSRFSTFMIHVAPCPGSGTSPNAHGKAILRICGDIAKGREEEYYCQAIAEKESAKVPNVDHSIDRRTDAHLKRNYSDEYIQSFICFVCVYFFLRFHYTCDS